METVKVTTNSGFTCEVSPERFDDYEIIEALADTSNEIRAVILITNKLLGSDAERLKQHCTKDGIVKFSAVQAEVTEIINKMSEANKKAKNFSSSLSF